MSRRLRAFVRWMKSQGFQWSDAMEFVGSSEDEGGVSVKAVRDLNEGEVVATIPKAACLTVKNSEACDLIESAGLGGCLGLSVALMYERSLGESSPWAGYLQLLPESESVPLLWTLDEIDRFLQGTELHKMASLCICRQAVKEDKGLVFEDWEENILPLVQQLPSNVDAKDFEVDQYFAAKSLVSSRAFEIDDYHGHGMVPLADLFNHKTGAEDVHFTHSEYDDDEGDNSNSSDLSDENGGEEEPSSDLESSSEEPSSIVESSSINGDHPTVLEMIMVKDVKRGAEIFNTYGLVGNAALLHRYGFTELDNAFDIVNIELEVVLQWSSSLFTDRYSRARLSLWRNLGYSGCVSGETEYFEISNDGEPQTELLILLYIMLLPEETYLKLDFLVSTTTKKEETVSMFLSAGCSITKGESSEISRDLLLMESVCDALLWLADKRDGLYGLKYMKDDVEALERSSAKEGKVYYSLVLRVCERRIIEKLRCYAKSSKEMKRASGRKRLKKESSGGTQNGV
ncbi:Ribosomal lysine N-methyltransferase 3 [Linum perenne]